MIMQYTIIHLLARLVNCILQFGGLFYFFLPFFEFWTYELEICTKKSLICKITNTRPGCMNCEQNFNKFSVIEFGI